MKTKPKLYYVLGVIITITNNNVGWSALSISSYQHKFHYITWNGLKTPLTLQLFQEFMIITIKTFEKTHSHDGIKILFRFLSTIYASLKHDFEISKHVVLKSSYIYAIPGQKIAFKAGFHHSFIIFEMAGSLPKLAICLCQSSN